MDPTFLASVVERMTQANFATFYIVSTLTFTWGVCLCVELRTLWESRPSASKTTWRSWLRSDALHLRASLALMSLFAVLTAALAAPMATLPASQMTPALCASLAEGVHVAYLLFYWADFLFLFKKASLVAASHGVGGPNPSLAYRAAHVVGLFGCTVFIPVVMIPLQHYTSGTLVFFQFCIMTTLEVAHHIVFLVCTFLISAAYIVLFAQPLLRHATTMADTNATSSAKLRAVVRKNVVLAFVTGVATIGTPIMAITTLYTVDITNAWGGQVGGIVFGMDIMINALCAKAMTSIWVPRGIRLFCAAGRDADDDGGARLPTDPPSSAGGGASPVKSQHSMAAHPVSVRSSQGVVAPSVGG